MRKSLFLYLFIIAVLLNVFTYKYSSSIKAASMGLSALSSQSLACGTAPPAGATLTALQALSLVAAALTSGSSGTGGAQGGGDGGGGPRGKARESLPQGFPTRHRVM